MEKLNQPIDLLNQCLILLIRYNNPRCLKIVLDKLDKIPKQISYKMAFPKLPYLRELKLATVLIRDVQGYPKRGLCNGTICATVDCRCDNLKRLRKIFKIANVWKLPNANYEYSLEKCIGDVLDHRRANIHYKNNYKDMIVDFSKSSVLIGKITINRRSTADKNDYDNDSDYHEDCFVQRNIKVWYWQSNESLYNYKTHKSGIINSIFYKIYCICQECKKPINENNAHTIIREPTWLSRGKYLQCCSKCVKNYYGYCEWCSRRLNTLDDILCYECFD